MIKHTAETMKRLEKTSFKKLRDAGFAGEDYVVLKNALECYMNKLQKDLKR